MYTYTIDFASLSLLPDTILREMGYGNVEPAEEVKELVSTSLDEIASLASPSCCFKLFEGDSAEDSVVLETGERFQCGKTLATLLKGSTRYALFAATAGNAFQKYMEEVNKGQDILKSFIVDVIGSCLVEAVGDQMEMKLEKEIGPDRHTHRFSPGYCGWNLTEQKQLFSLLGGAPCGIHLSEVCLMTPVKSISGVIGIGQEVNEREYGCLYCELETCYKRKRKKK